MKSVLKFALKCFLLAVLGLVNVGIMTFADSPDEKSRTFTPPEPIEEYPVRMPPIGLPRPKVSAVLTSPASETTYTLDTLDDRVIAIEGTAAGEDFASYELQYRGGRTGEMWIPIGSKVTTSVENGPLGTWALRGLNVGLYTLRLLVTARDGRSLNTTATLAIEFPTKQLNSSSVGDPESRPVQSDHYVVWADYEDTTGDYVGNDRDIFVYTLATGGEQQIITYPERQLRPAIWQNTLVWQDKRNVRPDQGTDESQHYWDIYSYDLATKTERQITTFVPMPNVPLVRGWPSIWKNRIVWMDNRGNVAKYPVTQIYVYDLKTNTEQLVVHSPADVAGPRIFGNHLVWMDLRNGNWNIYLYDFQNQTERPLSTQPAVQGNPAIWRNYIVWQDNRNRNWDIYLYDLATQTERQITTDPRDQQRPAIWKNYIVWDDNRNGNADIFLFDLATHTEYQITANPREQSKPAIFRNRIVWYDTRNAKFVSGYLAPDVYRSEFNSVGVRDEGDYTAKIDRLFASWKVLFRDSDITQYKYSITEGATTGPVVKEGSASNLFVTAYGLHLADGKTYFFRVEAKDREGHWKAVGYSDGITVDRTGPSITDQTEGEKRIQELLFFQAKVTDAISGVKRVVLELRKSDRRTRMYAMDYNATTRLYEVNLPAIGRPATLGYRIIAEDRVGNQTATEYSQVRVTE